MTDPVPADHSLSGGRVPLWLARAAGGALVLMMALTFCDVVGRYFFDAPIVGTVEVTELLMGMMVYLAIGLTTFSRSHIQVDILTLKFPPTLQAACEALTFGVSAVLTALMSWQLWLKAGITLDKGDLTQIWLWPVWPAAYVMAASSIVLPVALGVQSWRAAQRTLSGAA